MGHRLVGFAERREARRSPAPNHRAVPRIEQDVQRYFTRYAARHLYLLPFSAAC